MADDRADRDRTDRFRSNGRPQWVKVTVAIAVPGAMALALGILTGHVRSPLSDAASMLASHKDESAAILRLMRLICRNTAYTETAKIECSIGER